MCQIAKQVKGNRGTQGATDHWRTKGQRIHLLSTILQIIAMIKELDLFVQLLNNFKFSCIWKELSKIIYHVIKTFVESLLFTLQDCACTQ